MPLISTHRQRDIKPRFEVHQLDGETCQREVRKYVTEENALGKKRNTMVTETVEEPAGYMAYFPNGNSIRVRTQEELRKLSLAGDATLVDMETGQEVEIPPVASLKTLSERKTRSSKPAQKE